MRPPPILEEAGRVQLFGFNITRGIGRPRARGGWAPLVVREPFTGAWQKNAEIVVDDVLGNGILFAVVDLIAREIGKMRLRLMQSDAPPGGIWTETTNPAYSPVLAKPNRYQTTQKFVEAWILSKLVHGNTYMLKERDLRGVVKALYVLDPTRVTLLVAPDGAVYYELAVDPLAGIPPPPEGRAGIVVPAREIIHDLMVALYHPLIGVSPIYACGAAAMQGLRIEQNASAFFANGSRPGGILLAPGAIQDTTAQKLKAYWEANFTGDNAGRIAVLGDGLKYEQLSVNPVDAQLVDQLKMSAQTICTAYHVPLYMIDQGAAPAGLNAESLVQLFYSQCLQAHVTAFEIALDAGLELAADLGTEFDIDDLIWFDTPTRTKAAHDAIGSGGLSPNEARARYFGVGPVAGGASPYMQQQYYSLAALAERDASAPFTKAPAAVVTPPAPEDTPPDGTKTADGRLEDITAAALREALAARNRGRRDAA